MKAFFIGLVLGWATLLDLALYWYAWLYWEHTRKHMLSVYGKVLGQEPDPNEEAGLVAAHLFWLVVYVLVFFGGMTILAQQ